MTPVQGEPPKINFKLPKRLKGFLNALRKFAIESQPINGPGLKLDQFPQGRLLSTTTSGETLFYSVQNGELRAYRIPATPADAPGLE